MDRSLLMHKLLVILHRSLVQARELARNGNCEQVEDLADTFEIVPELMADWKDEYLDQIRAILAQYQGKYPGSAYDYLATLNMSDADFLAVHKVPAEAAAGWA